jgi:type IV pilus assembly protein PilY1
MMNKPFRKSVAYLVLAFQILPAYAAPVTIASVPVDTSNIVPPNIIFALDDSGSMDMEVLQDTEDGAYFFKGGSFFDATKKPNFNGGLRYGVLFPNGTAIDARTLSDSTPMYAIPPLPEYAFARSSNYNSLYYNPAVTYYPWVPAYLGGASKSFGPADPAAARSHPYLPVTGTATVMSLTTNATSEVANYTFKMGPGMVIPANTRVRKNGGAWTTTGGSTTTIGGTDTYDVNISYYPATYWVKVPSCPAGGTCTSLTPDGGTLQRIEIRSGRTFPSGRTYVDELQNFANWFQYYRKRKLMLAASMGQVLSELTTIRGGVAVFNDVTAGVRPDVTMYDFSAATPATNWQAALGIIYQNEANGGTPTRDTLAHVGKQFMRTDANAPIQFACQRNAAMVLTDGFATSSTVAVPAYLKSTYGAAAPYDVTYASTLADIALYNYTANLRSTMTAGQVAFDPSDTSPNADKNRNLHMNTYALTLGANGTIYGKDAAATADPFAHPPTWPSTYGGNDPAAVDDLWHATINGRGLMLSAGDSTTTAARVQQAIADVLVKAGSQSAVAVSRVNLKAGDSTAYVSSYQVNGWYGDLQAFAIDPATAKVSSTTPLWSAQKLLDAKASDSRLIAIGDSGTAVAFKYASMSAPLKASFNLVSGSDGPDVVDWLRGNTTLETKTYRNRSHILGDLVYSEPEVVKGAIAKYLDTGYAAYITAQADRAQMLYQGGNDGMLHAFDATTGAEKWAYIPSFVTPRLKNLASKSYSHQFYVDGSPVAGDVYIGGAWQTILVSGLRAGGAGFFALNVTDPTAADDNAVVRKVMWEFPNASTPVLAANNVGLSFGKPIIAKVAGQGWVVLVTSGYNNAGVDATGKTIGDGKGHLFVLNAQTGALIADIPTTAGSPATPSGLGQISAYVVNGQVDATVDTVYGGDLMGNVWRFNLAGATSTWSAKLLATLTDGTNPQPITSAPELSNVSTLNGRKRMVFVGTGQLLASADITNTQVQSFYGLVDDLSATPTIATPRTSLTKKTVTATATTRDIPGTAVDYSTKRGWYFDFPAGERGTTDSQAAYGAIVFSTNAPSSSACSSASYLYAVGLATGGDLPPQPGKPVVPAGQLLGSALASRPVIVLTSDNQVKAITHLGNDGVIVTDPPISATTPARRMAVKAISR